MTDRCGSQNSSADAVPARLKDGAQNTVSPISPATDALSDSSLDKVSGGTWPFSPAAASYSVNGPGASRKALRRASVKNGPSPESPGRCHETKGDAGEIVSPASKSPRNKPGAAFQRRVGPIGIDEGGDLTP